MLALAQSRGRARARGLAWPGLAPAMLSPPRRRRVAALRLIAEPGSCGAWPAAGGCWRAMGGGGATGVPLTAPNQLKQRSRWRNAGDELRGQCQRSRRDRGVQVGAAAPGDHCAADLRGARTGLAHRAGVVARGSPAWRAGRTGRPARGHPSRAIVAPVAAGRLRPAVDFRRDLAGPAEDGDRPSVTGHPAHGREFAALGAARGELGGHHVVLPPDAGRSGGGMDPGWDRHLVARRGPGPLVAAGRAGRRGLGLWSGCSASPSAGSSPLA